MTLILGAAAAALAVQSPSTLSLADAIREAEAASTTVRAAKSDYEAARARTGEEQSRRLPQLGFQATATRFDDRTVVTLPGGQRFEVQPDNQEALTLALSQNLDVSGQLGMIAGRARLLTLSAGYRLSSAAEDQDLATTVAYYGVLRAEQNVQVAQASLDAYREQETIADRLYKGGVGQKIDTLRAQSQVAEAERELVRRQNELDSARSALNDLLGRRLDAPLSLQIVTLTLGKAEPEGSGNGLSVPGSSRPNPGPDPSSVAQAAPQDDKNRPALIAQALDRRPEALAASLDLAAARKGVSIARTGNAPTVLVSLTENRYPTTSFVLPRQNVVALGIGFSVPLFDGGLTREQAREAKSDVESAQARLEQTRRDISLEVQNAALDVETEHKRLEAANVALTAATAAQKLAQQRFESQVGLYIEVTDAQAELTSALAAQVQATYDLLTAQARLDRALSRPLIP